MVQPLPPGAPQKQSKLPTPKQTTSRSKTDPKYGSANLLQIQRVDRNELQDCCLEEAWDTLGKNIITKRIEHQSEEEEEED